MARPFFRRRKSCPFSAKNAPAIDYKDVRLLQGFMSERGKIVPRVDDPNRKCSAIALLSKCSAILD